MKPHGTMTINLTIDWRFLTVSVLMACLLAFGSAATAENGGPLDTNSVQVTPIGPAPS